MKFSVCSFLAFSILFVLVLTLLDCNQATSTTPTEVTASVTLSGQSGKIVAGTAGNATFTATSNNVPAGTSGSITWFTTVAGTISEASPTGITGAVSSVASNAATVTITTTSSAVAGSYFFSVTFGTTTSAVATMTVSPTYSFSTVAQYGSETISPYTFYNNLWGEVSGSVQTLYVNSSNDWYVAAYQPYSTGGIKSYPNISIAASDLAVSSLTSSSTFSASPPSSGIWDQSYDIWVTGSSQNTNTPGTTVNYEIMLWTNWTSGSMYPISDLYVASGSTYVPGPFVSSVTVGGQTWNLYCGNNGSNAVYSFLAATATNGSTLNVAAILQWLQNNTSPLNYTTISSPDKFIADKGKSYLPSNAELYQLQFGWEIVSTTSTASSSATPATLDFKVSSYSATAQ